MRLAKSYSLLLAILLFVLTPVCVCADGGGTAAVFGQDFFLEEGERLDDDLVVIAGRAHLQQDSILDGDVVIVGGEVEIEGTVTGDVAVLGGSLELGASSVIEGDVVAFGRIRRHPEAEIHGNMIEGEKIGTSFKYLPTIINGASGTVQHPLPPTASRTDGLGWGIRLLRALGTIVALLIVAALAVVLLPDTVDRMTDVMSGSALLSLGVGLLTILLSMVLLPLLVLICIGIPVAIVLALALMIAGLVGWVAAGKVIGQKVLQVLHAGGQTPLVEVLVGVFLISVLAQVECAGPILSIALLGWGLGAVVLTRFGTVAYPLEPGQDSDSTLVQGRYDTGDSGSDIVARDDRKGTRRLDKATLVDDLVDIEKPQS